MINWIIPAVIAIIFASVSRVIQKSIFVGSKISSEVSSVIFQLVTGLLILIAAIINGLDFSGLQNLIPNLFIATILYAGMNYFLFKAYRESEGSTVTILFSTNAGWMLLASALFLGESITFQKVVGILLIISVTVIISNESGKFKFDKKLFNPLFAAFIIGFAFVNDAYVLRSVDLLSYLSLAFILPGLALIPVLIPERKYKEFKDLTKMDLLKNLFLSAIYAMSAILTAYSFQLGAEASIVGPLQQLSVLGTVILSFFILKEKSQIGKKLLATALAVVGGVILTLS